MLAGQARAAGHLLAGLAVGPVHIAGLEVDVAVWRVQPFRQAAAGLHRNALHPGHRVLRVDRFVAALDLERGHLGLAGADAGAAAPVFADPDLHVRHLAGAAFAFAGGGGLERHQGQRLAELQSGRDLVLDRDTGPERVEQRHVQVLPGEAAAAGGRVGGAHLLGAAHAARHEAAQAAQHAAHVRQSGHVVGEHVDVQVDRRGLALLAGGRQRQQGGGQREQRGGAAVHGDLRRAGRYPEKAENGAAGGPRGGIGRLPEAGARNSPPVRPEPVDG
ncbi:hypothetical protein LJB71_03340 [Thermomonas sp. S9]|uniref:hypothetical protein n=1 Tax=Thermomonas sp. S9 TaxID=2885203 RepID=UPI00216B03A4|nr:hypothetical protein [Thermomonas sp. S9]MCR6495363.1 hypothetical protein [Thermomonas sp. S9]